MLSGVTTACDMGAVQDSVDAWDSLEEVYVAAADEESLPMRLMAMVPLPTWSAPRIHALKDLMHSRVFEVGEGRGGGEVQSWIDAWECWTCKMQLQILSRAAGQSVSQEELHASVSWGALEFRTAGQKCLPQQPIAQAQQQPC